MVQVGVRLGWGLWCGCGCGCTSGWLTVGVMQWWVWVGICLSSVTYIVPGFVRGLCGGALWMGVVVVWCG